MATNFGFSLLLSQVWVLGTSEVRAALIIAQGPYLTRPTEYPAFTVNIPVHFRGSNPDPLPRQRDAAVSEKLQ